MERKPEFVQSYFDWLKEKKGLNERDEVRVGLFCHAFNGGIRINADTSTGVPGLFACGEVTGGMHGADRLGGLSTANGLVFGRIAGKSSALYATSQTTQVLPEKCFTTLIPNPAEKLSVLRGLLFSGGMVFREERTMQDAVWKIEEIKKEVAGISNDCVSGELVVQNRRLQAALSLSESLLRAMLLRRESRGSHSRVDYPVPDPTLARRILVNLQGGCVSTRFKNKEQVQ